MTFIPLERKYMLPITQVALLRFLVQDRQRARATSG
jgi:hypothetical protein